MDRLRHATPRAVRSYESVLSLGAGEWVGEAASFEWIEGFVGTLQCRSEDGHELFDPKHMPEVPLITALGLLHEGVRIVERHNPVAAFLSIERRVHFLGLDDDVVVYEFEPETGVRGARKDWALATLNEMARLRTFLIRQLPELRSDRVLGPWLREVAGFPLFGSPDPLEPTIDGPVPEVMP